MEQPIQHYASSETNIPVVNPVQIYTSRRKLYQDLAAPKHRNITVIGNSNTVA